MEYLKGLSNEMSITLLELQTLGTGHDELTGKNDLLVAILKCFAVAYVTYWVPRK